MDEKELLTAIGHVMDDKLNPINQRLDRIESKFEPIYQRLDRLEDDVSTIKLAQEKNTQDILTLKDDVHTIKLVQENTIQDTLTIIQEGIAGINEKFDRQDAVEATLEDHAVRIYALEQVAE